VNTRAVGFFPAKTVMTRRLQRFGYVTVNGGPGGPGGDHPGPRVPPQPGGGGHPEHAPLKTCYDVEKRGRHWRCGYTRANTLAG